MYYTVGEILSGSTGEGAKIPQISTSKQNYIQTNENKPSKP